MIYATAKFRALAMMLAALLLSAPLRAALDEAAFTDRFAAALEAAYPDHVIEIVEPLHIELSPREDSDGSAFTAFLDNAYIAYRGDPEALDDVVETWVGALADTLTTASPALDAADIVPIVKDTGWPIAMREAMLAQGATDPPTYHSEALAEGLVVLFAEDRPNSVRYLSREDLESVGADLDTLREDALGNLRPRMPELSVYGGEGLYLLEAGGNFEASLLLVDTLWTTESFPVEGELVIAVPSRDAIIVTGTGNVAALQQLRQLALEIHAESPYRLTPEPYVRRDGRWQRLDP